ncbi:MAG: alpha/beta hydrolase, partial [Gammaproteobacteria bacterium]|nr:alpha/beta hydrolase [Gammaproteobacteria bacterium]NIT63728.1 alpha/beta hydrolase [Gammaproteobacteria bacterium]NIV20684.1 alpha/beta hydrolase [Gammaproteobacteria bacterium]NIY32308.1 alpha/beta hydrolase [Gammaproteobacteria bacterium]
GVFFQPNRIRYYLPDAFDLQSEDVFFESTDGTPLTGWFLPAQGPPRGTVVFFHGNAANISNHLVVVRWLPAAGYAVFIFDY